MGTSERVEGKEIVGHWHLFEARLCSSSLSIDPMCLYTLARGLGCPDSGNDDKSVFLFNPTSLPDNGLSSLPTLLFTLQHPEWKILFPLGR